MMSSTQPMAKFPTIMRPLWEQAGLQTQEPRMCDALSELTIHRKISTQGGDYWICGRTGQMVRQEWLSQPVTQYDQWWQEHLKQRAGTPLEQMEIAKRRRWLKPFTRYRQTGYLYEIGVGMGWLLQAAQQMGWQATGSEISPVAAAYAQPWSRMPIHVGAAEDMTLEAGKYDVILVDNVFEHLEKPGLVLERLAEGLRPGGVIYVHTICAASLSLRWHPQTWYYFNESHYFVPTPCSFQMYAARLGLRMMRMRTHGYSSSKVQKLESAARGKTISEKILARWAGLTGCGHRLEVWLSKR